MLCDSKRSQTSWSRARLLAQNTTCVDRSAFAERFESALLRLETLTPHQEERLRDARGAWKRGEQIHVCGPAGSGKTFVGLHLLLEAMTNEQELTVLIAAKNEALLLGVVNWVCSRVSEDERSPMLRRIFLLHDPFDTARTVRAVKNQLITTVSDVTSFGLGVVDEAHHVLVDGTARKALDKFGEGAAQASDQSQAR